MNDENAIEVVTTSEGECYLSYRDLFAVKGETERIARQAFNAGLAKGFREASKRHGDDLGARFGLVDSD